MSLPDSKRKRTNNQNNMLGPNNGGFKNEVHTFSRKLKKKTKKKNKLHTSKT